MEMPRLFLPHIDSLDRVFSITGEKAHYLTSVLRCKKGDDLIIFGGEGRCIRASITKADRKEVVAEIVEQFPCDPESPLNLILVQGLLKGENMDLIVRKTTELGIKELVPVITGRSQLRDTRKALRWRKIAEEASRQSGRSSVPVVHEPVRLEQFLCGAAPAGQNGEAEIRGRGKLNGFIFWEDRGLSLNEAINRISVSPGNLLAASPIHILIGAEGGFTPEEVALAAEKGFQVVSLGRRILRSETAAIASVALVQYLLGDMGEGR